MHLVFAQQARPSLEVAALVSSARRFFRCALEVRGEIAVHPFVAAARVRVDPEGEDAGERACWGRAVDADDVTRAERAEAARGYGGLALLARRCGAVWLVETRDGEAPGAARSTPDDAVALRIAAILASVLLGPILTSDGALIGVRSARARFERR